VTTIIQLFRKLTVLDMVTIVVVCIIVAVCIVVRGVWRDYMRHVDEREELHRLASDAAAAAGVKYADEHPRELQAAIYGDGTAEDAASYRKGQRAAEEAAYKAVLADPIEARAAAQWEVSVAKIHEAKANQREPES
jgi:uncharacterized membrane protein YcjF (UPF0283 family)